MIVLFIKARLEHVADLSLPKGCTYTVTVILMLFMYAQVPIRALHGLHEPLRGNLAMCTWSGMPKC